VKATSHLRREAGVWYYGSDPKGDSTGPFRQSSTAMHSLRRKLIERRPELAGVVFWSAVLFPFLRFNVSSNEWHAWQVIDRQGYMSGLGPSCRRVLMSAREYLRHTATANWFQPNSARPSPLEADEIVRVLRPEFEVFQSVRARVAEREAELKRFTGEQYQALDALERNDRVLFEGPAGTGKTILAMEATRRATATDRKVALLCFNRLLGTLLASEMAPSAAHVSTLHALMLEVRGPRDGVAQTQGNEFWSKELPEAAIDSLLARGDDRYRYDELVVDEAQDLMQPLFLDFLDLCLAGGLRSGRWRLFGDFERQALFGAPTPILADLMSSRAPGTARYALRINCRNVPRIASVSCMLGGLNPPYTRILRPDGGIEPRVTYYEDGASQVRMLRVAIDELIADGFRPQDIVVLSPRSSGSCAELFAAEHLRAIMPRSAVVASTTTYTTVHAFKGLEAPCIILTDVETVDGDRASSLFYTAVTRALDRLIILAQTGCRTEVIRRLTAVPQEATG